MDAKYTNKDNFKGNAYEHIKFLSRSYDRFRILFLLCKTPHTQPELVESIDVHRTTVRRNLRELKDRGWVKEGNDRQYTVTPPGKLVMSGFSTALKKGNQSKKLNLFLSKLPQKVHEEIGSLSTENIVLNEFDGPFAAVHEFTTFVKEENRLRLYLPELNPKYVTQFAEQAETKNIEIISPRKCFKTLSEMKPKKFKILDEANPVSMFAIDNRPSIGLCLGSNMHMLITYNDGNGIHGILRFDEIDPNESWIVKKYNEKKERSQKL